MGVPIDWVLGREIPFVTVPVMELGPFPAVPTRHPAHILRDPGQPVYLFGPALRTFWQESSGGGSAVAAGDEFGSKDDLLVFCLLERPDEKTGKG